MKLSWRNYSFDFTQRTYVMGILNVTPDSFSDGGSYLRRDSAVERALAMESDGADIIDVGGESTRPGAEKVSVKEEIQRVVPVIEEITKRVHVPVSIDTRNSAVAEDAVSAGASMINDISGLRFDPRMPSIAALHKIPVVIMHIKGTPENMQKNPVYKALIPEIMDYLREGIHIATQAGIPEDRIILDPGIGFGKAAEHNLQIIQRLNEFEGFEKPVLLGHSRKSFIGRVLDDLPVTDRLEGTAAAAAIGIFNGANIIRVHDVKEMVRVARTADAIRRGF
ncbi:MAG: dihydropteroate synthase [Nitrospira bacterium SG8_35_4]|nr:MAG: dihydropteroate synthase [Nitrospira bacterium SG8_35_4]